MTTYIGAHLAAVEALRTRPFPARPSTGAWTWSGPGHHVAALRVSEDFWDADLSRVQEVDEEFHAESEVLVRALSRRWGDPEVWDLTDHLERSALGEPVPPPLDVLCGYVGTLHTWQVAGRWIAIGVGQADRELPIQLIAAVADGPPR
ncbi:hypothetical protein [Streptomyces sp. NPDC018031]|uniref:hypothetical protein n=1 Tax=Streptomyces sp. NPDC018031 TaxID=3365033 RepID=UPI00379B1C6B